MSLNYEDTVKIGNKTKTSAAS